MSEEEPKDVKTFKEYKDGLDNLKTPTKSAKELLKDNYSKELANLLASNPLTPSGEERRDFLVQEIAKLGVP